MLFRSIVNSLLIGVETYHTHSTVTMIQNLILYIFTIEIALRFLASDSLKQFFSDGWNLFDLSLVLVGYIPETMFENASAMMALRVLRVFRVLRLLRAAKEMKVITRVRDKNFMIFNQAKDNIEYWAAFQGRLIYLYSLVLLIPEDKLPV